LPEITDIGSKAAQLLIPLQDNKYLHLWATARQLPINWQPQHTGEGTEEYSRSVQNNPAVQ